MKLSRRMPLWCATCTMLLAPVLPHAHADDANWRDITRSDALLDRTSLEAIAKRSTLDTAERARLALALARIDALLQKPAERAQALQQLAGERARLADALGSNPRAGSILLDIAQDALLSRLAEGTTDAECALGIPTRKEFELAMQLAQESRVFIARAQTLLGASAAQAEPADDVFYGDRALRAPALEALALALLADGADLVQLGLLGAAAATPDRLATKQSVARALAPLASDVGKLPSPLRENVQLVLARFASDAARTELLARVQRSSDPVLLAQLRAITCGSAQDPLAADLTPNALGLFAANASVRARMLAQQTPAQFLRAWALLLEQSPEPQREVLETAVLSRVSKQLAQTLAAPGNAAFAHALAGAALARDGDARAALVVLRRVEGDRTAMRIALPLIAQLAASEGDAAASAHALFTFAQTFPQDLRALESVQLALEIAREAQLPTLGLQLEVLARVFGQSSDRTRWLAEATDLALDGGDATLALRRADLLQALGGEARGEAATRRAEAHALELLAKTGPAAANEGRERAETLAREATQAAGLLPVQSPLHARLAMVEAAALAALGRWSEAAHRAEIALADARLPSRVRTAAMRVWLAAVVARGDAIEVPASASACVATQRALLDDLARAVHTLVTEAETRVRAGEMDAAQHSARTRAVPIARLLVPEPTSISSELSESMRVDAGRAFAAANEAQTAVALLAPLVDAGRAGRSGTYAYALLLMQSPSTQPRALECFKALAPLQVEAAQRDEVWWLSQLAMLEMISNASTGAALATRQDALPRLHRLRAIDPTFGSPAAMHRFATLEKSLSNGL